MQNKRSDAYFAIKSSADIINRYVIASSADKERYILSASFRVAIARQDDTEEDAFLLSDKALYRAKGEGVTVL